VTALEKLTEASENHETRADASIIMASVMNFSFFCYLSLWCAILPEEDKVQNYLQTKGLALDQTVIAINSLHKL